MELIGRCLNWADYEERVMAMVDVVMHESRMWPYGSPITPESEKRARRVAEAKRSIAAELMRLTSALSAHGEEPDDLGQIADEEER